MKQKKQQPLAKKKTIIPKTNQFDIAQLYPWIAVLLSILVYVNVFKFGFTTWDDNKLVTDNLDIQTFSLQHISNIFSNFYAANYHPITMFSYMVEHSIFGLNPVVFHTTNIVLHGLNTYLVYHFIRKLTENGFIAFFVSLLFGIHPMHVESVAWIAERKDLLYATFLFLSLIHWINYVTTQTKKYYWYTLVFFVLSLLSKPASVILPPLLLALDYYYNRFTFRNIHLSAKNIFFERLPFLLLALVMGVVTLYAQKEQGGLTDLSSHVEGWQRVFVVSYSFVFYFFKILMPIDLSAFYPYPTDLHWVYYVSLPVALGLMFFAIKLKNKSPLLFFAAGFFVINLLLTVQIIPIGQAVTADRYSYVSAIGVFLMFAVVLEKYLNSNTLKMGLIALLSIVLMPVSISQTKIWKDSLTLYNSVLERESVAIIHYNRGLLLKKQKQYAMALKDFDEVVKHSPSFSEGYSNRAFLREQVAKDVEGALSDYNKAIALNPNNEVAYNNRGLLYYKTKRNYSAAIKDFDTAIQLNPNIAESYNNRANAKSESNDPQGAMQDYTKAISLKNNYLTAYTNRAFLHQLLGNNKEAIEDFSKSIALNPAYTEGYTNRGILYAMENKFEAAIKDFNQALLINPKNLDALHYRALTYKNIGNLNKACADWSTSAKYGNMDSREMLAKYCNP